MANMIQNAKDSINVLLQKACEKAAECRTLAMWRGFYELTNAYFDGITLADLMRVPAAPDFII